MIKRRHFLKNTLALSALTSQGIAYSATSGTSKSMSELHEQVLAQVRELKGERSISLKLLHPDGCQANLKPLIEYFQEETGIHIEWVKVGVDDINNAIIFRNNQQQYHFDIALPATFGIPDLVRAKTLAPLDHYAKQYEPAGYKELQLYNYGDYFDGSFYGYQTDGDTYLMFYNKDMMDAEDNKEAFLKQHNYPLDIPQTWEQLDDMIRFFHKPDEQQYGGCLYRIPGYGAWEWWSRFHGKGYYPLDDDLNPQINNSAGIKALQEMLDISNYLHPKTASDGLFENWATFSEGNTFCNIGWGGSQKYFNSAKSKVKNKLYFSPAPGGYVKGEILECPVFNWGWNYVVSSSSKEKEIAYLFTLFACSPVMSTLSVQQADGFFDPYREEHYSDANIQLAYSAPFLEAHKQSMKKSIPDFYLQSQSKYLSVLQENIHLAYKGSLTAKQALDITAAEWKLVHKRVGVEKQKAFWLSLKEKYPEKLKKFLS